MAVQCVRDAGSEGFLAHSLVGHQEYACADDSQSAQGHKDHGAGAAGFGQHGAGGVGNARSQGTGISDVLTGEGCLDGQTAMGKAPVGVAALAKCFGVPVIALAGAVKPEARACNACGINAFFPILPAAMSLEQAMEPACAAENIARTAEQVFRLIACVTQSSSMPEKS